jgi:hypothetical protein
MLYQRDKVLEELRKYVMSVTLRDENNNTQTFRLTMKPNHLPVKYMEERAGETAFHQQNPSIIRCWDITKGKWMSFDIKLVEYCEDVTDRY